MIYRVGEVWRKGLPREIVRIIGEDGSLHDSTEGLTAYRIQWRRRNPGQIRHNQGATWVKWAVGAVRIRVPSHQGASR